MSYEKLDAAGVRGVTVRATITCATLTFRRRATGLLGV